MMQTSDAQPYMVKKQRCSNLELYRVICMLMIVAHHYVVNSGLTGTDGVLVKEPTAGNSLFLAIFGAWGKTGINCFLMITGYFMCTSKITIRKFIKLISQIYLYKLLLFPVFLIAGYETLSFTRIIKLLMPTWGLTNNFVGCFIFFWLTIPFLNILVRNMTKKQHQLLLILMLLMYTLLGSVPKFGVTFNYVTWFGIIYFIASYIRLYPQPIFDRKNLWGWLTLLNLILAILSIMGLRLWFGSIGADYNYYFVSDSNKFFAVAISLCSFLWFKNLKIPQSNWINGLGAGTFGVLLIHANSDAMRTWLWKDTVDVIGHYSLPLYQLIIFSFIVVITIFIVCNLIDQLRIGTVEKWFFNWYDKKMNNKADALVNKLL